MEFNLKKYQKTKTTELLKKNSFLFFSINSNQNSKNWLLIEQNLNKLGITYHKSYNNSSVKVFNKSKLKNFKNLVKSTLFFLQPKKKIHMTMKSNTINFLALMTQFTILAFKLNTQIYHPSQIKTLNTFNYKKNTELVYQFWVTTLQKLGQNKIETM